MAILTNTLQSFSAIGNREDLANTIYRISPTETPFIANCAKEKATATFHEWQTQALNAAAANAAIEGNDFSAQAVNVTTRLGNRSQISTKEIVVSGTQSAVNSAGRQREIVYQMAMMSAELRRDMEFVCLNNQVPTTGNSTTASLLRPVLSWYATNVQVGGGSPASGSTTTARTDGTTVAFTEAMFKTAIQTSWVQGGKPDTAYMSATGRANLTAFAGPTGIQRQLDANKKQMVSAISVYISDFGEISLHADRFQRARDVHVHDKSKWAIAYLRPVMTLDIAKTGDADKGKILAEYTVVARQEAASALVADTTN